MMYRLRTLSRVQKKALTALAAGGIYNLSSAIHQAQKRIKMRRDFKGYEKEANVFLYRIWEQQRWAQHKKLFKY